jgi:electron transfer flavoprotein alpha subunit
MPDIFAIIEHRQGTIRDISLELLALGRRLAKDLNTKLTAVLLASDTKCFIDQLKNQAHRIMAVDNKAFGNFNSEAYQLTLTEILKKENPLLTLVGHTAMGVDLAPALAAGMNYPCVTDCIDARFENNRLKVVRTMYDGKLNARLLLKEHASYLITCRAGSFPAEPGNLTAEIVSVDVPQSIEPEYRKFIEYVEAAVGDVDITKADIIIAVGRGVKEQANMAIVDEFARTIGGVLACTRPVVDAGWLPKDRQVGSSGKTVKPKLYSALGVSGAFQHIAGMKNSDLIIAVNKDQNAPIFNEADYGIVEDMFKVIPVLKNKILEMKQAKA